MNTNKKMALKAPLEPSRFKKRIGSTTYHVAVHFDPDAKETANDKIVRLVRQEAVSGKAVNQ